MSFQRIYYDYRQLKDILPLAESRVMDLYDSLSGQRLVDLLIVAEDHRNRFHIGVDVIAIGRALFRGMTSSAREGASTIEQQLVRVVTGDYRHSVARKLKEILLAISIRMQYDRRILALIYLDMAYYGTLYQSLDAILDKFGLKRCDDIDLPTCASIVARLKYPEPRMSSDRRFSQIKSRSNHILRLYLLSKKHNRSL